MFPSEEILRQRILALMPGLNIERIEVNAEGLVNDVVVVNRQWVFRFAKTEAAAGTLVKEMQILDWVRPRLDVAVPTPAAQGPGSVAYPFLEGQPLTRENLSRLGRPARISCAEQLGTFLHQLHTTPLTGRQVPATLAPVTRERWLDIRQKASERIYPLLLKHQVHWAEQLWDQALGDPGFFDFSPALIHADLAPYHILFQPQAGKISGILDFGVAGVGDPALDLGNLMTAYGERFLTPMQKTYPGFNALLPKARFYAQSIELQWVLQGLESGEPFWFTAHLGNARDIGA